MLNFSKKNTLYFRPIILNMKLLYIVVYYMQIVGLKDYLPF
jgi:hypothetical protein